MEDTFTGKFVSKILELLEDGEWHLLDEMRHKIGLNSQDLRKAIDFLAEYNFVVLDKHGERVRLSEDFLKTLLHKPL